jgi:16S rRNA (adenine1518-N6/adenine1519-N6)-dimethyltransferase
VLGDPGSSEELRYNLLAAIVRDAGVGNGDTVLEVGPGPGLLTRHLLATGARVIALEIDPGMRVLAEVLIEAGLRERLEWIEADVMGGGRRLSPAAETAVDRSDRLVANLPYNLAGPLQGAVVLRAARSDAHRLGSITVTVQKELAERLAASPGGRDYGSLSVILALAGRVRALRRIPPKAFWPAPRVNSTVVGIDLTQGLGADLAAAPEIEAFLAAAFHQRRKTLANSVAGWSGLQSAEVAARLGLGENRRNSRAEAFRELELYNLALLWAEHASGERNRPDP